MQDLIRSRPGVLFTRVGYTGGDTPNATYRSHGSHAEAIEITYDPSATTYRELLEFFFQIHDPSTPNRQGNDVGTSYRSAIFCQGTSVNAQWRSGNVPAGGHQICPVMATRRARLVSSRGLLPSRRWPG
jgi:methionine-S-sulfoxide reductase